MQVLSRWNGVLRFVMARREDAVACVLDGLELQRRRPVADLERAEDVALGGMVLLIDHAGPGAMEALRTIRSAHAARFDAGAVVVGIENLPLEAADALMFYRRAARAPVFAVDLARSGDRLLLQEAVVATRRAAILYRDALPAGLPASRSMP